MAEDWMTPGFRQGRERQRGIASGRMAPRDAIRNTRASEILNDNHLEPIHRNQVWSADYDKYDPNQGSLFDVQQVAPRSRQSDASRARELGAPTGEIVNAKGQKMGLAGRPGFMPGLDVTPKSNSEEDVKKAKTQQHAAKIKALQNVAEARVKEGSWRGGGHFAEMMEDRASAARAGGHADWYEGTNEAGQHDGSIGHAPAMIQQVAARRGWNANTLTRAVAQTSPQSAWQDENTGEFKNLNGAKAVVNKVTRMKRSRRYNNDPSEAQVRAGGEAIDAEGRTLPANQGKAAGTFFRHPNSASDPYEIVQSTSQKAPNFEASLHLSHKEAAVRRIASQAWTVDRHDGGVVGIDVDSNEFKRKGSYEAVAMTGRRAALKNRQLNPNEQAAEWVGRKSRTYNLAAGDAPRLFDPNKPNYGFGSRTTTRKGVTTDNRSATAQKYDLEF